MGLGVKVLVTNASYRNALATVRSLGRKGARVFTGDKRKIAQAFCSRYCMGRMIYTDPRRSHRRFARDLNNFLGAEGIEVLIPIGADTTVAASFFKKELERVSRVPISDYEIVLNAHDKQRAMRISAEMGIPTPKTLWPEDASELEEVGKELGFPAVVKARKGVGVGRCLKYVRSQAELERAYEELTSRSARDSLIDCFSRPIVQEYVPGEIHDVCVLFNHGEVRAALTQLRLKTLPPEGGVGVVNITTDNPELKELAINLMEGLGWHGVAQLEFKRDQRDGKFKLLEINPKFWGTLGLSIEAGIDFPNMLLELALEGDVRPRFEYKKGLKFRWIFPGEVEYLLLSSTKRKDLKEFLRFKEENLATDIWLSDPAPNVFQAMATFYRLMAGSAALARRAAIPAF